MKKYKISVIVPVYNVEKYIEKCLNSLVNQTLEEIEIIVVNDGSPDNSEKIINKFLKKYPSKIKYFVKENGGQGSARNFGLTKANGEYIGYVDSDDYVEIDMYEKMYKKAKEKNSDIVICGSYNVNEITGERIEEIDKIYFEDYKINAFFGRKAVWNKIYKKEIIEKNNLTFRSKVWYEDLDFTLNTIINAKKIDYVNEPFYDYLIREGSTMNNSNVDRNLEIFLAFDEVIKNKKLNKYKDIIEFLAVDHIYISTIVRVINAKADNTKKKETINKLLSYMDSNFKDYKKNKYLYLLPRNRKVIFKLLNMKQYTLIKYIFKIKRR